MDNTPQEFLQEFKSDILKKRVGQIALAVVLAEACLHFIYALVWYLFVPVLANLLNGHSESVLFETRSQFPLRLLLGSTLEFALALIFVFYANRWIHKRAIVIADAENTQTEQQGSNALKEEQGYSITGQSL